MPVGSPTPNCMKPWGRTIRGKSWKTLENDYLDNVGSKRGKTALKRIPFSGNDGNVP